MFRLKYHGKWIIPKRITGNYTYMLTDNPSESALMKGIKALVARNLISEDCEISEDEIEIVKEGEENDQHI